MSCIYHILFGLWKEKEKMKDKVKTKMVSKQK